MYKEIHPYYRETYTLTELNDIANMKKVPLADKFKPGEPVVLRLDTIREISRLLEYNPDAQKTVHFGFSRLVLSDDPSRDVFYVKTEEADEITKALMRNSGADLAKEVSSLTHAVRDLWNLLRARMR